MKPNKLYDLICDSEYITVGDDVDYQIIIDDSEKTVRLLFQESTSGRDWYNNLDFLPWWHFVKWGVYTGASGWLRAWKTARKEILSKVCKALDEYPDYKFQIAGWSYGGTIAVWAVIDLFHLRKKRIDSLVTFGAAKPLIGLILPFICRFYVKKIRQYAHIHDFVPMCPPFPLLYWRLGTKPVGKQWWKFWEIFHTDKWHCSYGDETYYKEEI